MIPAILEKKARVYLRQLNLGTLLPARFRDGSETETWWWVEAKLIWKCLASSCVNLGALLRRTRARQ